MYATPSTELTLVTILRTVSLYSALACALV